MDVQWLNNVGHAARRNSPAILSGAAIAGVIITTVLAVRATPAAVEKIADARDKKVYDKADAEQVAVKTSDFTELSIMETVKAAWMCYIPAGLAGMATIACIGGANKIGMQRNAALIAAYTLVDNSFKEYKEQVVEAIGDKKEEKVREAIMQRRIDEGPEENRQVIILGEGDQLCYDKFSGRYFRSDAESIRRAENEINFRIVNDMYAALNEFYDQVGLEHIDAGDQVGWNLDHRCKLAFTSHLSPEGRPCLAVDFTGGPVAKYGDCF